MKIEKLSFDLRKKDFQNKGNTTIAKNYETVIPHITCKSKYTKARCYPTKG